MINDNNYLQQLLYNFAVYKCDQESVYVKIYYFFLSAVTIKMFTV